MLTRLLLAPAVLALASPAAIKAHDKDASGSDLPADLLLHYYHETGSNQTELSLSAADKSDVYAHSCGDSLETAGHVFSVDVNGSGGGSVSVNDKKYTVVGDRDMSGGAFCTRLFNDRSVVVECLLPWSGDVEDLSTLSAGDMEECFSEESAERRRSLPPPFSHPFAADLSRHEKRLDTCAYTFDDLKLVGDGDPHQDILHKQVGNTQFCAGEDTTCTVGVGEEVSVTVAAELGAGAWFSGGFGVSKTVTSSNTKGCEADGGAHKEVCQWSRTYHTAYTAVASNKQLCNGQLTFREDQKPGVVRSPNDGAAAVEWYCVVDTCRFDGVSYWQLGRPGGPGEAGGP